MAEDKEKKKKPDKVDHQIKTIRQKSQKNSLLYKRQLRCLVAHLQQTAGSNGTDRKIIDGNGEHAT
jgi:hypothetical protein